MSQTAHKAPQKFTYRDYLAWEDDQRVELCHGVAVAMSPAPSRLHQRVIVKLTYQLEAFFREGPCQVYVGPFDVRLPEQGESPDEASNVVQPDIAVICDPGKLDDKGCVGAPDWIIEILSPKTASHDQIQKRALYETNGVKEYWLVHPIDHVVSVYLLQPEGQFGKGEVSETSGKLSPKSFPRLSIDWEAVFADIPPSVPEQGH